MERPKDFQSLIAETNRINLDQDGDSVNDHAFDSSGNTKDASGRTFIYDAENKQIEVKNASNETIGKYWYDGDGRRVKKHVPSTGETTVFVYDASSRLVAEYSTTLNPTPQVAYLTNDHLGTPRIDTNENGTVISRHDYRPYGEEITERTHAEYVGDTIRKQFTGYERDSETDLDFAQARMFSNRLGRFSSSDPTKRKALRFPQSWNRYTYVFNRPLTYTDGDGNWPTIIHDLIIRLALPNLSSGQINAVQVGSFSVDVPWTLFAAIAYQHAMRRVGQSEGEARTLLDAFVETNNLRAMTEGNGPLGPSELSLYYFGRATHPLTDNTSPTHRPFQIYDDSDLLDCGFTNLLACYNYWNAIDRHMEGESYIFNSDLQNAITAIRNNFRAVYGDDALKKAVGLFGNARYVFPLSQFGLQIDGQDNPEMVDLGNLGTVTVHADGSTDYEGPLTPAREKSKKKKK